MFNFRQYLSLDMEFGAHIFRALRYYLDLPFVKVASNWDQYSLQPQPEHGEGGVHGVHEHNSPYQLNHNFQDMILFGVR